MKSAQRASHEGHWAAAVRFYRNFAAQPNWEFLEPMSGFTEWVAQLPVAKWLYPSTSHEVLVVSRWSGYKPNMPFVTVGVRADGRFQFESWAEVGRLRSSRICPAEEAKSVFEEFLADYGVCG